MCQIKAKYTHKNEVLPRKHCISAYAICILKCTVVDSIYIRYKLIYYKMHISQLCDQREYRHPPTDIYPPIAGRKYSRQVYKLQDAYSPNRSTKGADTPSNWHISSNWWQYISKKNVYLSKCIFPSATDISPNCWQYIQYKWMYYVMNIAQPKAQRAYRHFETELYPPIVGIISNTNLCIFPNPVPKQHI